MTGTRQSGKGLFRYAAVTAVVLATGLMSVPAQAGERSDVPFDAVYVVNGGDGMSGSITVINADTDTVAGTIELPDAMWPHHAYLSPDRSTLAVAAPGMDLSMGHGEEMPPDMRGEVILVGAASGAIRDRVMTDAMNHNAIFSADGREIWTSQMMMDMPGMVRVLDATTLATKTEIEVGDMPAEVTRTPRGEAFYVANSESGTVSVVDAATKRVVNTVTVGDEPVGAWQAGNGYAYVDNEESETVSAINRRTQTVTTTFDLGFMPGMAQLGPDGHLWVTDADNGRVVLFSLDTVARHQITVGAGAHGIVFSGDRRTAYVTNQLADTVSVVDVRSRIVKKTLPTGTKPNGMAFRPAG
jgi:YVTN family beta-propeller protein